MADGFKFVVLECLCLMMSAVSGEVDQDVFYPFGPEHGDQALPPNDDDSSGLITINISFPFFGKIFSELYVNTNGGVSFGGDISSYTPEAFPLNASYTFIAVYWSDVDTRFLNNSQVYYRETTDPELLARITNDVTTVYGNRGLAFFQADWGFIATWTEVTYFSGQDFLTYYYNNEGETNTYQMAILSDGTYSFTIFNYGNLMWTTGLAVDGQIPAQVGFNAGDGVNYFVVPDSRTSDIINIQYTSNVGIAGRWMFRIDQATINAGTCFGIQSDLTPAMGNCPTLSNPVLEDGLYVYFYCDIMHNYTNKDAVSFEVDFLFDNVKDATVPTFILKGAETRAGLHEKYLHGNLGKQVSCQVSGYYDNMPQNKSFPSQSNSYFAGIQASSYSVTVYEGDKTPTPVYLKSTLPIACSTTLPGGSLSGCGVNFNIDSSDNLVVYQPGKGTEDPFTCQYRLDHTDWKPNEGHAYSEAHPLYIFPTLSLTTDPPIIEVVTFQSVSYFDKRDEEGNLYTFMWNDYQPPPITVYRYESAEDGATCYASGDPRMTTFDKTYYSVYAEGQFVMAKSSSARQFEVHVRHEHCMGNLAVACVCGLAVNEGNDTILLDMCNGKLLQKGHKTASSNGQLSQGMKLSCNEQGNTYTITTPSGSFVNIFINIWGMNVNLRISGKDFNTTEGLCGTYDGVQSNDLRPQGSSGFVNPEDLNQLEGFVQSWRIPVDESLFEKDPSPVYPDTSTVTQYCECTFYALDEIVPCGNIADPLTYPEITFVSVTVPTLQIVDSLFTSTGRKKRDLVKYININYDYDPSDFEFAEDSVNALEFSWPTITGITEDEALEYCQGGILHSDVYSTCQEYVDDIHMIVAKCLADVQASSNFASWADDKVAEIQDECKIHILQSTMVSNNHTSESTRSQAVDLLQGLFSVICPSQCSGHGECRNSSCFCDNGYEGVDCSVLASSLPDVVLVSNSGVCDLSLQPCTNVMVLTENLIFTETLSCQIEETLTGDISRTTATFEGIGQVRCGMPGHRLNMHTYRVSVSRNGVHYGSHQLVTVFDGYCMDCSESTCTVKDNSCSIGGTCYNNGDSNPEDSCLVCNSAELSTAWTETQDKDGICGGSSINYALVVCLSVFLPIIVGVLIAFFAYWFIRRQARIAKDKTETGKGYLYQSDQTCQNETQLHAQPQSRPEIKQQPSPQPTIVEVTQSSKATTAQFSRKPVTTGMAESSIITPVESYGNRSERYVDKDTGFDCSKVLTREDSFVSQPPVSHFLNENHFKTKN